MSVTGSLGSAGSRNICYPTPISLNVTLPNGTYPNGTVTFNEMLVTNASYFYNKSSTLRHTTTFYLCDSTGNNKVKLFDVTIDAGSSTRTPNSASISGGQALAGKALYIISDQSPGYSDCYIGIANYCTLTINTAVAYTAVTSGNKIGTADINQTGTSIASGTTIQASIKSGLTSGSKITAADFNSIVLGL